LPLRRIWFLDEQYGWAVGALGCILHSDDGGRSWRVQRRGGQRAALAGMFATAQQAPWELLAGAAANDGYITVAHVLTAPREGEEKEAAIEDRFREAASFVGATSAMPGWPFPTPVTDVETPLDIAAARWDRGSRPSAVERMDEMIVRQIRIWRPDVIVCDASHAENAQPLSRLASQVVWRAVERAGNADAYPEQLAVGLLRPWSVKRVFNLLPPGQRGTTSIDTQRLAVHLGCSLAHYATISRALVADSWNLPPSTVDVRLVYNQSTVDAGRELFSGIAPGALGDARRAPIRYGGVNLDSLSLMLDKQRRLQEIVSRGVKRGEDSAAVLTEINQLASGLTPHYGGVLLHELAQRFAQRGDYASAADVLQGLVERYPDHLLTQSCLLWLWRYYSSAEWQRAFPLAHHAPPPESKVVRAAWMEPVGGLPAASGPGPHANVAAPMPTSSVPPGLPDALQRSLAWGDRLRQLDVPLYQEAYIQFPMAAVQRRCGKPAETARIVSALANSRLPSVWHVCARGEQWLLQDAIRSPRPVIECRPAQNRPFLDGILDDEAWRQSQVLELKSPDPSSAGASAMLAYDAEFLYVAVYCPKLPRVPYPAPGGVRPRDGDLSPRDRVELLLDVDRDYVTSFRLAIDSQGWTNDACGDEPAWNPAWHVAAAQDERQWSAEAAIPLAELELTALPHREPWALGVQRVVPGGPPQTWPPSGGASLRPENGGYLVFQ
jgi:hypothetical protein